MPVKKNRVSLMRFGLERLIFESTQSGLCSRSANRKLGLFLFSDNQSQLFFSTKWLKLTASTPYTGGPGSVVGIATGYGLEGSGIESRWWRDLPHPSRPALGPTQLPIQWVPGLSRGKERPGRDPDPSPPSSAVVMKG